MPAERFVEALSEQIDREFAAAHQYTALAAWYEQQTLPRLARFFFAQADEERGHAMKMIGYLRDTGAELHLGAIPAPRTSFEDHVAPIRLALEGEKKVTAHIAGLFEVAREAGDYAAESFVSWFVDEQVEEEATMDALLTVAERVRDNPMLLEDFLARDGAGLAGGEPA
jgi:ferritin